jgi:hypothetical protein
VRPRALNAWCPDPHRRPGPPCASRIARASQDHTPSKSRLGAGVTPYRVPRARRAGPWPRYTPANCAARTPRDSQAPCPRACVTARAGSRL